MAESSHPLGAVPVAAHGHQIVAGRRTVLPPESEEAVRELAASLAAGTGPLGARKALREICARHPEFLDGWARLGQAEYLAGDPVLAYACARTGYHRGLDRLRRHGWGGSGEVRWEDETNRGFLGSLHLLMVCAAALGEGDERQRCRSFLLDLDPADGLGVGRGPELADGQTVSADLLP